MLWLTVVSVKRHWSKYLLAIVGLAAAVAVTCFGLSGAALLSRMSKHPLLQTAGGDLMVYDKRVKFDASPGRLMADPALFSPFRHEDIKRAVSEALPGSITTGTLMIPVATGLQNPMYAVRPLNGRDNAGAGWIYRPHMVAGAEVENDGSPQLMLAGANSEHGPFGERVGQVRTLVIPAVNWDGNKFNFVLPEGKAVDFELVGLFGPSNDLYWTGLSMLQKQSGMEGLVNWAGVALANPLMMDEAKRILQAALEKHLPTLAVMSVDELGEMMIADFGKLERTTKFYTPVIILLCTQIIVVTALAIAHSRRRELALLRCLGLSNRQLQTLFVVECLAVAVMGSAIGLGFYVMISKSMFKAYILNLWPVGVALIVTMLVAVVAAKQVVKGELAADMLRNP